MAQRDQLVTELGTGQAYLVELTETSIFFAPCAYLGAYAHVQLPKIIEVRLIKPSADDLYPLAQHEKAVQKLLRVWLRVPVAPPIET